MKSIAVIACAAAVALVVAVSPFATAGSNRGAPQKRSQCTKVRKQVAEYRQLAWRWQEKAGLHRTNAGHLWNNAGCHYVRWVAERWRARAWQAKRAYHHLPETNDWRLAVRVVQRVYPGTDDWLLYISDREGGYGPWVWYSGSCGNPPCLWRGYHIGGRPDVVGGPMQYRYSTFIGHWHGALRDIRRRGFKIPDLGWARPYVVAGVGTGYGPWLSPLGQALAAAYVKYHGKEGCNWCL